MNIYQKPIINAQVYPKPIEIVWKAITEVDQMKKWFFENIPAFEARIGFHTEFNVKAPSRDFLHIWEVTEVMPPNRLTYTWQFIGHPGNSYTTWELSEEGNSTRLKLSVVVTAPFPQDIPEFKRESGVMGWNYFLGEALRRYLERL